MSHAKTAQIHKSVTLSCVSNYFYFASWSRSAGRSAKTYENGHFQIFFAVWVLFLKFLCRLRSGLY